ncbi:MAG: AAA family ATPase [Candidatus Parcubacteria bacterium]|nr:AAA family ATPase [Candidatus Paceibacterota bacterium]
MTLPLQSELNNWKLFANQRVNLNFLPVQNSQGLILLGPNGSGKTSILEAYYSLLTSKPWPGTKFNQSISFEANYFGLRSSDNQWFLNGQINPRGRVVTKWESPENQIQKPAVFWYQPNFNYWLGSSRADKLKILDMLIVMSGDSDYNRALAKLNQSIKGKQNLIKQCEINPEVDDIILNQLNNSIYEASKSIWSGRKKFFDKITCQIGDYGSMIETDLSSFAVRCQYSNISGYRSLIEIGLPSLPTATQWASIWNKELIMGQVLFGAHRDDFDFEIRRRSINTTLSRGEKRLFTFFVIELAIKSHRTINPEKSIIFLADDIFNELDTKRNLLLFDTIVNCVDFFLITSAQDIAGLEPWSTSIDTILV